MHHGIVGGENELTQHMVKGRAQIQKQGCSGNRALLPNNAMQSNHLDPRVGLLRWETTKLPNCSPTLKGRKKPLSSPSMANFGKGVR